MQADKKRCGVAVAVVRRLVVDAVVDVANVDARAELPVEVSMRTGQKKGIIGEVVKKE